MVSVRVRRPARGALAALLVAAPLAAMGADRSGSEVYAAVCSECHATGKHGAPMFGDAKAWKKLIREGQRTLVRAAIRGERKMPPRGGEPGLSNIEVERAVVHMANAAGGRFVEPK